MKEKINSLLNGVESELVNEVVNLTEGLSTQAQDAVLNELTESEAKIKKFAKAQRPASIKKIINRVMEQYPAQAEVETETEQTPEPEPTETAAPVSEEKKPSWTARSRKVYQYDKTGNLIAEHNSVQAAHRATNISDSSICYCCNGKTGFKTAGGFKWSYEPIALAE